MTPNGLTSRDDKDGVELFEMEYDNYGNVIYAWEMTADGNLMLSKKFNQAGKQCRYNNEGQVIEQFFLGTDKKPMYCTRYNHIGFQAEYDENGFIKKGTYIDENGNPTVNGNGVASFLAKNDAKGNRLENAYYDLNNQPYETSDGYFRSVAEYDSSGNQTSEFYYDTKDSLCLTTSGYAGLRCQFNDKNKLVEYTYYGADNLPCEVYGIVTVKYEYDPRGNETKRSFYAANGQTPVLSHAGIACRESKYDDNGNETEQTFFDTQGERTIGNLGYAGYSMTYNKDGYLEEIRNLDKNGNLVYVASDGYASIKYKYDERGNCTEKYPYSPNGQLIGKYIEHDVYDSRNNIMECLYFDAAGNKTVCEDGYHKYVYTYNDRNQVISQNYYDTNGKLINTFRGYSTVKITYDNRENQTKYALYNTFNKSVTTSSGYATLKIEYDIMNRKIKETYLDANDDPTRPSTYIPERLYQYDKWGNQNYYAYANGHGHFIDNQNGWAINRREYDIRGKLLVDAYYDKDEEPCLNKEKEAHKIEYKYNERGKNTETCYYGIDESLRKNSYAIERCRYNEQGKLIELTRYIPGQPHQNFVFACSR